MRDTRREVRDKWQTILENLGKRRQMICVQHCRFCIKSNKKWFASSPRLHGRGRVAADSVCRRLTWPHAQRPGSKSHASYAPHRDFHLLLQRSTTWKISLYPGEEGFVRGSCCVSEVCLTLNWMDSESEKHSGMVGLSSKSHHEPNPKCACVYSLPLCSSSPWPHASVFSYKLGLYESLRRGGGNSKWTYVVWMKMLTFWEEPLGRQGVGVASLLVCLTI